MRKRHSVLLLLLLICSLQVPGLMAQGRSIPRSSEVESKDETLLDILPEGQKYRYPLLNGLNVSVDIFDPFMELFYFDHATYEAQLMADLYHRYFPMFSMGIGHAKETSNNGNDYGTDEKQEITFESGAAPFFKLGIGYNLDYNSTRPSDYYMLFARYGYAHSTADITNLYYADDMWGSYGPVSILDQTYNTHWLEAGLMLKVQLMRHVSLGWDLYWKIPVAQTGTKQGKPSYVPGYGMGTSSVGFAFRVYYDLF